MSADEPREQRRRDVRAHVGRRLGDDCGEQNFFRRATRRQRLHANLNVGVLEVPLSGKPISEPRLYGIGCGPVCECDRSGGFACRRDLDSRICTAKNDALTAGARVFPAIRNCGERSCWISHRPIAHVLRCLRIAR